LVAPPARRNPADQGWATLPQFAGALLPPIYFLHDPSELDRKHDEGRGRSF
jgi:hypothetical protein